MILAPIFGRTNSGLAGLEHRAVADLAVDDIPQPVTEVEQPLVVFGLVHACIVALDVLDGLVQCGGFPRPIGDLEEVGVEGGEFTRAEVAGGVFAGALLMQGISLQVVGALAQHLSGLDVVLHDGLGPVLVDGADLHADGAALVAGHDRTAALVDELVLLNAPPPDLLAHQGAAGAAVDAYLAYLAEGVETVVDGLVEVPWGSGGE